MYRTNQYSESNQHDECPSTVMVAAPNDKQQEERQEVTAHTKATEVVVLGAFIAGSLFGIIIFTPAIGVVLLGAGAAGLCFLDGKVGEFARKVGKDTCDILLAIIRKCPQLDDKDELSDKAKEAAQEAVKRVKEVDENHGLTQEMQDRATSMWAAIDERHRSTNHSSRGPVDIFRITDGTKNPFNGTEGGAARGKSSYKAP